MIFCKDETMNENKYNVSFNYNKDKVKPKPKIYINRYSKNDITVSRPWYGLNIHLITVKN
tara:strand:- start:659 stop:838 length:180 start_codon:yes stop_codon:yes gene_type:complete